MDVPEIARTGVVVGLIVFGSICLVGGVLAAITPLSTPFVGILPGRGPSVATIGTFCCSIGLFAFVLGEEYQPRPRRR